MTIFKIREKATGMFSKGGRYIGWEKVGATWQSLKAVQAHVRQINKGLFERYDHRHEIVECILEDVNVISIAGT